jgi:hypothetical protein
MKCVFALPAGSATAESDAPSKTSGRRGLRAADQLLQRVIPVGIGQRTDGGAGQPVAVVVGVGLVGRRAVIGEDVAGVVPGLRRGRLR